MARDAAAKEGSDDRDLIVRMGRGDEAALAELYDRWVHRVYTVAWRVLGDQNEAEEIVEATFWQAWISADRFDSDRASVGSWLMMMVRSRSLDRRRTVRRTRERQVPIEGADGVGALLADSTDPLQAAESSERGVFVARALGELSREQRQVVELAFFGGLSQSEIATYTGLALGTVKTRVRLAMQKLRGRLDHLRESHHE